VLFTIGCLAILAVAFLVGVSAGRHWPAWLPSLGGAAARAEREAAAARRAAEARPRSLEPSLTFYQELIAPLAAPPPPPRPERPIAKPAPPPDTSGDGGARPTVALGPGGTRYAVQVGAFKERGPAETMRAMLMAVGWEAYLAEIEGTEGARFRVRVGSYATRDEARHAAQRLSSERRLSTYVTLR
jgi:cell division protein FtsN